MTTPELAPLVEHIHAAISPLCRERSDEDLLRAFASGRDDSAFNTIVRRYGGLVLGVCRRALGHEQDAEDAFQATFLVLVRNADRIRKGSSLSSWLHGVSYRVACRARQARSSARQRASNSVGDDTQARPADDELGHREVRELLDEEVQSLPELYREPFVLCCLEGRGRGEVAGLLGLKEGTLSSRLAEARKRLQQALRRRGVSLATLPVLPAVPAELTQLAVRTALLSVLAEEVPVGVLDLAQGATGPVSRSLGKVVAALLLAAGALAGAVGLLPRTPHAEARWAAGPSPKEYRPGQVSKNPTSPEDSPTVLIEGRVVGPDGKPAAGASVFFRAAGLPDEKTSKPRTTADPQGRFRFHVGRAWLERDPSLAATAKGAGPAWVALPAGQAGRQVLLKLRKDSVPLTGRLINLEGQPLEGVTVEVLWVGQHTDDRVADWIGHFVAMRRKGFGINETGLRIGRPAAGGLPRSVTTDRQGRFRIAGIGDDRVVTLVLRSERTVSVRLQATTRTGPLAGWVKGEYGLYPTGFTFLLGPAKPIRGTVRDRKTGKPIAGVIVSSDSYHARTTTNEKGEYCMLGTPKQARYLISLGGGKGTPYLDHSRFDVRDTPGLEPLKVDFELERGVEITGRVLDKVSGKPVRGEVQYFHTSDNPNLKSFVTIGGPKFIVSQWGQIGPDGSFAVLGIPGPGVLVVLARDSTRYARIDVRSELQRRKIYSFPSRPSHAILSIDVSEKDPRTLTHTIHLTPAGGRTGLLVDANGKAVTGAKAVGHRDDPTPSKRTSNRLVMAGLSRSRDRVLIVLHEERKLGAVVGVRGDSDKPFEVKLQALGTLTGRLVDGDGKPLPDRKVLLSLWLDPRKYENLPQQWGRFDSMIYRGWGDFTTREAKTDSKGRFRVEGLLPGQRYDLDAGEGQLTSSKHLTHRYGGFQVEAGQVKDTGDLKPKKQGE